MVVLWGCQKEIKAEKPEKLIPKEEMTNILYDMFVISSSKGSSIDVLKDNGIQPDAFVLDKYGIDSLQFKASNDYYAYDIDLYLEILGSIQERLETEKAVLEQEIEKEQEEKKRQSDSIEKQHSRIPGKKAAVIDGEISRQKDSMIGG
jgi:hypothetical protein